MQITSCCKLWALIYSPSNISDHLGVVFSKFYLIFFSLFCSVLFYSCIIFNIFVIFFHFCTSISIITTFLCTIFLYSTIFFCVDFFCDILLIWKFQICKYVAILCSDFQFQNCGDLFTSATGSRAPHQTNRGRCNASRSTSWCRCCHWRSVSRTCRSN